MTPDKGACTPPQPYLHQSRHNHATRRIRGAGGRFLTAEEAKALEPGSGEQSGNSGASSQPSDSIGNGDSRMQQQQQQASRAAAEGHEQLQHHHSTAHSLSELGSTQAERRGAAAQRPGGMAVPVQQPSGHDQGGAQQPRHGAVAGSAVAVQ